VLPGTLAGKQAQVWYSRKNRVKKLSIKYKQIKPGCKAITAAQRTIFPDMYRTKKNHGTFL